MKSRAIAAKVAHTCSHLALSQAWHRSEKGVNCIFSSASMFPSSMFRAIQRSYLPASSLIALYNTSSEARNTFAGVLSDDMRYTTLPSGLA